LRFIVRIIAKASQKREVLINMTIGNLRLKKIVILCTIVQP